MPPKLLHPPEHPPETSGPYALGRVAADAPWHEIECLVDLWAVAKRFGVTQPTARTWVVKGYRGRKLAALRAGKRFMTSMQRVNAWLKEIEVQDEPSDKEITR